MSALRSRPRIALLANYLDRAYQSDFRSALELAARSRGVDVIVAVGREIEHGLPHERALNRVYHWLSPQSIDGLVLLSAAMSNFSGVEAVQRLCQALSPLPSCSVGLAVPEVTSIVIDNRSAMKDAVSHLIDAHGCRRIAYIGGPDYNEEALERLAGYRDALEEAGIAFEPERVTSAHFTTETGYAALHELIDRGISMDGVVAANDYMALGAADALFEREMSVPDVVKLVGFDDVPIARFARRSLTTIAQPFEDMAAFALDALLAQIREGRRVPSQRMALRMVARESCGCGYLLSSHSSPAPTQRQTPEQYLHAWADEIERRGGRGRVLRAGERVLPLLARGLAAEIGGERGAFLRCVELASDRLIEQHASTDELSRALVELHRKCQDTGYRGATFQELERACLEGRARASAICSREHGRRALGVMDSAATLRSVSQDMAMVLSSPALARSFQAALRDLGIATGYLAVRADDQAQRLKPLLALESGFPVEVDPASYPAQQLFPAGFPAAPGNAFLTLLPLTVDEQVMGLVALESRAEPFVCEALRSQLSAALELGALHTRVVEETAVRERLAHEQLLGELAVARRIQSALCPSDLDVPGFEVAAQLAAADQVGGDYYDVIPCEDGCWVGIGDVTGHGLLAGLIMLMLQSSVRASVHGNDERPPSEVVCRVNAVLEANIRRRLHAKDHATFLMLRAYSDGRMLMAGGHEDVIVHRSATGQCELLEPSGVWVGISEDIRSATVDQSFRLEPGDTLLLYTDGLIEARDASQQEFDIGRVCEVVKATAAQGPRAIVDALTAKARDWTPLQQDDITIVALRRSARAPAAAGAPPPAREPRR